MRKSDHLIDIAETEVNPFTAIVAQPGRYSERSSSIDDSGDQFYTPIDSSKMAIMRSFSTYSTSSVLFIKYVNLFGNYGGFEKMFSFLNEKNPNQKILMQYTRILKSCTDFLVEDVIKNNGSLLLKKLIRYALNCTEQNLRETSQEQLQTLLDAIEGLSLRIMNKYRSQRVLNLILLKVFFICIQSEILDKQNFAMKIFAKIERNIILSESNENYRHSINNMDSTSQNEEDKEKDLLIQDEKRLVEETVDIYRNNRQLEEELTGVCDINFGEDNNEKTLTKEMIAQMLDNHQILPRIIKGHGSLIQKSTTILKLLFSTEKISDKGVEQLWVMINKAEVDTRMNLLGLLKDCTWQMKPKYVNLFLNFIIDDMKINDLPMDLLELVLELRKVAYSKHDSKTLCQMVNDILWIVINKKETNKDVFKKGLQFLIRFTVNDEDQVVTEKLFQKAMNNLIHNQNILISLKVISKILKESKMEEFYINQILEKDIHINLVKLIIDIKKSLDKCEEFNSFGILLKSKDQQYYLLLKKTLKFISKLLKDEPITKSIMKNLIFGIWNLFFESSNNLMRENDLVNKFVKDFIKNRLLELEPIFISEFLKENISKLDKCIWTDFYFFLKDMFFLLNEKKGNLEKDEIILDGGYFNDYNTKKLEFYVLKVPTEELCFFNELENIFSITNNNLLENFLCEMIGNLICKPEHASSDMDALYVQEENKLIQKLFSLLSGRTSDNIYSKEFLVDEIDKEDNLVQIKKLSQKFIKKTKFIMLINYCMGMGERKGVTSLSSFSSFREGFPLLLNFEKESKYQHKSNTKFFINDW